MKTIINKILSMLIVISLMVGITNIPVYAGASTILTAKTTDAVLSKTYVTPTQAVKKAVKSSVKAKATAKPTATKKATAKKAVKKTVSLTSQIIKKYTKQGLTTLKAFANKMGLKLQTVYNQFVKYGVTKSQMKKAANGLLNMVKRGADFCVCSTLAVAKYLGISQALTAVQQIAAEISLDYFDANYKEHYIATTWQAQSKVLSKNGVKNSEVYYVKKADFLNMKKGTKMLVNADCYNKKGQYDECHAVTITREKNGNYGVYDVLVNGGNKVVYTINEFKKFLNGQSAKGRTESGKTITKSKYLDSALGVFSYKFIKDGEIYIVGNSNKIIGSNTKTEYNKSISLINKLLNKKNLNSSAKTWLKQAKIKINTIFKSGKSNWEKYCLLLEANSLLENIKKAGLSMLSVIQNTTSMFSSLKSVLKNNFTYKVYNQYEERGLKVISEISKKFNLSQSNIYNIFVNNNVTKVQMNILWNSILDSLKNENPFTRVYAYDTVNNALREIKNLVNK